MTNHSELNWATLDAIAWREAVIEHGAVAGVEAALARIDQRNPHINAFTCVLAKEARQRAQELDALPAEQRGPLHGVPVAIKDENDVAGTITSFGTRANTRKSVGDSLLVKRLRDAGAIIIGKTTMPAFGAFPFTESEAFGVTRNPRNLRFTPGGSSGGSAAAVADGMVPLAIGGDGGGSIRIPADRCGLVGLKPARGVVPTAPYDHLWHHLGVAGPITRTVRDAELVFNVITGQAERAQEQLDKPLRIAVNIRPASPLARLHPMHKAAVETASKKLVELGHNVECITLTHPDPTPPFFVQFLAGIRDEIAALDHPERIETRHKLTKALSAVVSSRVLDWAKRRSEAIGVQMERQFEHYDVILTPSTASRPDVAGRSLKMGSVRAMLASIPSVAYTVLWNVSGHPAITIPMGTGADGLPTSVQLITSAADRQRGEHLLCALAEQLMNAE